MHHNKLMNLVDQIFIIRKYSQVFASINLMIKINSLSTVVTDLSQRQISKVHFLLMVDHSTLMILIKLNTYVTKCILI